MKCIFLLLALLISTGAKSQDAHTTYLKFECSGVTFSHMDSVTHKRVIDNTLKKDVIIYLEKESQSHIIIKEGGKAIMYKTTGFKWHPEEATTYEYRIDPGFSMEVFIMHDSNNRALLYGRKGNLNFNYKVIKSDLDHKGI